MKYGICGYKLVLLLNISGSLFCMEEYIPFTINKPNAYAMARWIQVREVVTLETAPLTILRESHKEKVAIEVALEKLKNNTCFIHDVRALYYAAARDDEADLVPYFATHRAFNEFKNEKLFYGLTAIDAAEAWNSCAFLAALEKLDKDNLQTKPHTPRFSIRRLHI